MMMRFIKRYLIALGLGVFTILQSQAQGHNPSKLFLLGRFNYVKDTAFVKVASRYTAKPIYLQKETYRAYIKMYEAALKDGIMLTMLSGTRNFIDQRNVWERKWEEYLKIKDQQERALKILRFSSMPGTSRHHWGTDMDLVNLNVNWFNTPKGEKMYNWMVANAAKYGFYQPYTAGRVVGYQEEKWHWSYLPLSKGYLHEYLRQITYADYTNFEGSKLAQKLDMINNRVLAINPACK